MILVFDCHISEEKIAYGDSPIHALNTETYNGDIFYRRLGRPLPRQRCYRRLMLEFLFAKKYQGSWNFFHNIAYDAESILKLLGDGLNVYAAIRKTRFEYNGYIIKYVPSKYLQISKSHTRLRSLTSRNTTTACRLSELTKKIWVSWKRHT
jgi:hypothetical protein